MSDHTLKSEELDKLCEIFHRYDGGIAATQNNGRPLAMNTELGQVFWEMAHDAPYSWNINTTRPSEVLRSFLSKGQEEIHKCIVNLDLFTKDKEKFVSGEYDVYQNYSGYDEGYSKYGSALLDYYDKFHDEIVRAENMKQLFADVCDFLRNTDDPTFKFMRSCLRGEEQRFLYHITETLGQIIEDLDEKLQQAIELRDKVLSEVIDKADEKNGEMIAYLKENENAFDMMDLKLHNASTYEYMDMESDFPAVYAQYEGEAETSPFYQFCDQTYDQFEEWLKEQKIDWNKMRHSVGRTSSFYLHDEGNFVCLNRRDYTIDVPATLGCITDSLGYSYDSIRYMENGKIDRDYIKEDYPNGLDDLLYIASGQMSKETLDKLKDVIEVYDYIKDIKEHQVEYFKDWLVNEEEYIKDTQEER